MALKVGVVKDERYLEHKTGLIHPEHPNRLKYLYRMLDAEFARDIIPVEPQLVMLEDLELVHTPAYVKKVLRTADRGFTHLAVDTPASDKTYIAAWLAAGGCIRALEALLAGECDTVFSLARPPGHHALADRAGGFCIFNNLGIAARYAQRRRGISRILILDWDLHHGNAIQDLFYRDSGVLYISSHGGNIFPYTGAWEETGEGEGLGYTVNLVLPKGFREADLLHVYREVVGPAVLRFRPQVIMVAAGFDLHQLDIMTAFQVTESTFRLLTRLLLDLRKKVGDPPLLLSLEGGYRIPALVPSVREVFLEMLADGHAPLEPPPEVSPQAAAVVEKARGIHRAYGVWTD